MAMQLLTAREVGTQLGIPETKVRAEARAGRFPHHKIGRYRRFSEEQIRTYLELRRVEPDRDDPGNAAA
jgi:excisionase family DNA binding protein